MWLLLLPGVWGHGMLTKPVSRALFYATNDTNGLTYSGGCPDAACTWYTQKTVIPGNVTNCNATLRTMSVNCGDKNPTDFPCTPGHSTPWCAPGTAPVRSPCGIFSGGWNSDGRDMLDLPRKSQAQWKAGSQVDIAFSISANHGGGYTYRICPVNSDLSEACFQQNVLEFTGATQEIIDVTGKVVAEIPAIRTNSKTFPVGSTWTRNPVPTEKNASAPIPGLPDLWGRGPFFYSIQDKVIVPKVPAGEYVLSWRWDAEQTKQVWSHCSDVTILSAEGEAAPPALSLEPVPPRRGKHSCLGSSLGLDVNDCDNWVELYDALDGPNWGFPCEGADPRTDPCGCNNDWRKSIVCAAQRDYMRITEIYLLGPNIKGVLPDSLGNFDAVISLSFVQTSITGSLPASIGYMPLLTMIWFDHNPTLGGQIPASFTNLKNVTAFELHSCNFFGRLPLMDYANIPDCTLNNQVFSCPLPAGAETCGAACR